MGCVPVEVQEMTVVHQGDGGSPLVGSRGSIGLTTSYHRVGEVAIAELGTLVQVRYSLSPH